MESRPNSDPVDNDASTAVVTVVHAESYLDAAAPLAKSVALPELLGCAPDIPPSCADAFLQSLAPRAFWRTLSPEERASYRAHILAAETTQQGLEVLGAPVAY